MKIDLLSALHNVENLTDRRNAAVNAITLRSEEMKRWLHDLWAPTFKCDIEIILGDYYDEDEDEENRQFIHVGTGAVMYGIQIEDEGGEGFSHTLEQLTTDLTNTIREVRRDFSFASEYLTPIA